MDEEKKGLGARGGAGKSRMKEVYVIWFLLRFGKAWVRSGPSRSFLPWGAILDLLGVGATAV